MNKQLLHIVSLQNIYMYIDKIRDYSPSVFYAKSNKAFVRIIGNHHDHVRYFTLIASSISWLLMGNML